METFSFFRLRFRRAYDSAYDSFFWFSLGHKRPCDFSWRFRLWLRHQWKLTLSYTNRSWLNWNQLPLWSGRGSTGDKTDERCVGQGRTQTLPNDTNNRLSCSGWWIQRVHWFTGVGIRWVKQSVLLIWLQLISPPLAFYVRFNFPTGYIHPGEIIPCYSYMQVPQDRVRLSSYSVLE